MLNGDLLSFLVVGFFFCFCLTKKRNMKKSHTHTTTTSTTYLGMKKQTNIKIVKNGWKWRRMNETMLRMSSMATYHQIKTQSIADFNEKNRNIRRKKHLCIYIQRISLCQEVYLLWKCICRHKRRWKKNTNFRRKKKLSKIRFGFPQIHKQIQWNVFTCVLCTMYNCIRIAKLFSLTCDFGCRLHFFRLHTA